MAQSLIRWKNEDKQELQKAIRNFNSKISRLEKLERDLYLPEKIRFSEVKSNIYTRSELNRIINSLRRFSRRGAEQIYMTQSGEMMTVWERKELGIQSRIAQARIKRELKRLNEPLESGFSKAQMGSLRVRELEAQRENLKKIESLAGSEAKRLRKRIAKQGTSDYEMKKALIYRKNYIQEMEKYKGFIGYDEFMKKLRSINNPLTFYNTIRNNDFAVDLQYQSDQTISQQNFNMLLEAWGVISEDIQG